MGGMPSRCDGGPLSPVSLLLIPRAEAAALRTGAAIRERVGWRSKFNLPQGLLGEVGEVYEPGAGAPRPVERAGTSGFGRVRPGGHTAASGRTAARRPHHQPEIMHHLIRG